MAKKCGNHTVSPAAGSSAHISPNRLTGVGMFAAEMDHHFVDASGVASAVDGVRFRSMAGSPASDGVARGWLNRDN